MKQPDQGKRAAKKKHDGCHETQERIFIAPIAVDANTDDGENERQAKGCGKARQPELVFSILLKNWLKDQKTCKKG